MIYNNSHNKEKIINQALKILHKTKEYSDEGLLELVYNNAIKDLSDKTTDEAAYINYMVARLAVPFCHDFNMANVYQSALDSLVGAPIKN